MIMDGSFSLVLRLLFISLVSCPLSRMPSLLILFLTIWANDILGWSLSLCWFLSSLTDLLLSIMPLCSLFYWNSFMAHFIKSPLVTSLPLTF